MKKLTPKPKPKTDSLYYTPLEVAQKLHVDRRTVYEWLRKGKLEAVKFGGSWRIPRKVLESHG